MTSTPLDPPYGEHPADAITEADAEQEERDRAFGDLDDDATLGPDGAVDLNPDRCPSTWKPGVDTPLGKIGFDRVRCTARVNEIHQHRWDTREQDRWVDETRANITTSFAPSILLQTRAEPTITIDALAQIMCRLEGRRTGKSFDEVVAPGIERWTRHRYEAEQLLDDLHEAGYSVNGPRA